MTQQKACPMLLVAVMLWGAACSQDGSGEPGEDELVIGAVFADDLDELSDLELDAVRLAVEEINASGAFERTVRLVNRSPTRGDMVDPQEAAEGVRLLYDQDRALAFVGGHGADASYQMIAVTNSEGYGDFVQCAHSAMDATSNIPGMYGADENDTFYRNVVTMEVHLELGYHVFLERGWYQIGLFRLDDMSGEEGSLGIRMIIGEHEHEGFSLAFDQAFPRESFVLEEHVDALDEIISMSRSGDVDVIVVGVLQAQANGIVKYLTENGYVGGLLFNTTSTTTDIFDIVTGFPAWLAEGNEILGIQPDNYQGKNSQAFTDAFLERFGQAPSPYGSTAYDCTFALALALLYSAADDPTSAGVWEHMPRFKEPNRTPDEVEIGIGADQFARAAEIISEGGRVALEGASGPLLFDGNGDRPRQGMCTFGPNQAVDGWEIKERYDSDLHKL